MTHTNTDHSSMHLPDEVEARLADELDLITQKIQQGETPDVSKLVADYPDMAETIRAYVRQIELLQGAGGSGSSSSNHQGFLDELESSQDSQGSPKTSEDGQEKELRIGDYRIEHEIGRGGMGVVYAARQISLDRPVALKILPFASSLDKMQITRFRNEARAAGQLHHPNIVPVFAVGCEDEVHFYAMQQIVGESLESVIRRQKGLGAESDATPTWLDTSPDDRAWDALSKEDWLSHSASAQSFDPDATASLPPDKILSEKPVSPAARGRFSRKKTVAGDGANGCGAGSFYTTRSKMLDNSGVERFSDSGVATLAEKAFEFAEATSAKYHRQIAEIGIQVAEALQYAHECGIIHRDIKPSNLLCDRHGKVWITDFGLARVQSDVSVTRTGDVIGTLRYMSPEQASGDSAILDQRTDVYSLGITLYELITLHEVFKGVDRRELLSAIAEKDPIAPRRLNPSIPIDLETIVLKAISKKAEQRYASAQELADDLERFLDGRPTLARRPTPTERLAKWAGRHKAAVRVAMILVVVAMVGFGVTSLLIARAHYRVLEANQELNVAHTQLSDANIRLASALKESEANRSLAEQNMHQAETNAQRAGRNYLQARRMLDQLGTQYAKKLDKIDGAEELRRLFLVDTLKYYNQFVELSEDDPTLSRDLALTYSYIGDINDQLGDRTKSLNSYMAAKQLCEKLIEENPEDPKYKADLGICLNQLGLLLDKTGKTSEARRWFEEAISIFQKLVEKYPDNDQYLADLALVNHNLGFLNLGVGNLDKSRADLEKACELLETTIARNPTDLVYAVRLSASYDTLSRVCQVTDRKKAIESCQKAIDIQKRLIKKNPLEREWQSDLAQSYHNLGVLLRQAGEEEQAEASYRKAIDLFTSLVKRSPAVVKYRFQLAVSENNLGNLLLDRDQYTEAGKSFDNARLALTVLVRGYPNDPSYHSTLGGTLNNLGMTMERLNRYADAAQTYFEAIKHQKMAHDLAPKVDRYQKFLSNHYINHARVLRTLELYEEAYNVTLIRKKLWKGQPDKLLGVASEMASLVKAMDHSFPNPTPEQEAVHQKISNSAMETLHEVLDAGVLTQKALQGTAFDGLRKNQRFKMLAEKLNQG